MALYPGSTPIHRFVLNRVRATIADVEVVYYQYGKRVMTSHLVDFDVATGDTTDTTIISRRLTQDESFLFTGTGDVELQLRLLDTSGNVIPSKIFTLPCERVLSREVLQ